MSDPMGDPAGKSSRISEWSIFGRRGVGRSCFTSFFSLLDPHLGATDFALGWCGLDVGCCFLFKAPGFFA